jgi:hypothetical protein
MSRSLDIKLKRPQQKSFPHINGLYLLLRASGLTQIVSDKKETKMILNSKALANWKLLNATERYFSLFYAWWHRGSDEIIGEYDNGLFQNYFYHSGVFFHKTMGKGLDINSQARYIDHARYQPGLHNLALMELFGFIQIELDSALSKENWPISKIRPTPWGKAFLNFFPKDITFYEHSTFEEQGQSQAEAWGAELKTYFPAWKNNLAPVNSIRIKDKTVVFKISLGKVYRKLAVPSTVNLDELANSILTSFNFSNDHLYEFIYKNDYGLTEKIVHSYVDSENGLFTSDCAVDELPISEGKEFIFHFDFGNDWRFLMVVESLSNEYSNSLQPIVIDQHGNPPEQYPEYDY